MHTPTEYEAELMTHAANGLGWSKGYFDSYIYEFMTTDDGWRATKIKWLEYYKENGQIMYASLAKEIAEEIMNEVN